MNDLIDDEFADAICENSIRTSKFLEWVNLDPMMPEVNKYYSVKEGTQTYPRRAMIRTIIWRKIKRIKYYTRTVRYLKDHPDEAFELGL